MAKSRAEKFAKKQQGTLFAFGGLVVIGWLLYSAFKNKDNLRDSLLDRIKGGGSAGSGGDGTAALPPNNGTVLDGNTETQGQPNKGNNGSFLDSIKQIIDTKFDSYNQGGTAGGSGGYSNTQTTLGTTDFVPPTPKNQPKNNPKTGSYKQGSQVITYSQKPNGAYSYSVKDNAPTTIVKIDDSTRKKTNNFGAIITGKAPALVYPSTGTSKSTGSYFSQYGAISNSQAKANAANQKTQPTKTNVVKETSTSRRTNTNSRYSQDRTAAKEKATAAVNAYRARNTRRR